ncbi:hypothetical protein C0993_010362 [Termitomyces sp. T159_Od127]|nr:hypothetical protein C0993_010362 [Termitomyces sp. T159_Od127]
MERPVTPENKPGIYKDNTICKTTKPVVVRIKDTRLLDDLFGINSNDPQELPAGSEVTVFDAQTVSLTVRM